MVILTLLQTFDNMAEALGEAKIVFDLTDTDICLLTSNHRLRTGRASGGRVQIIELTVVRDNAGAPATGG